MHTADSPAPVLVTVDEGVATITLNRPDKANGLSVAVKEGLRAAVRDVGADDSIRAVVLTGSGRFFSAGQDLGEHAEALNSDESTALDTVEEHYNPIVVGITKMPKPVLAAINGTCAGAALGLALACDVRIAVAGAKFTAAFTGIGLTGDSGLTATLARSIGYSRAAQLILLNEAFTAEQGLEWGLVARVVPAEEFPTAAAELAAQLAAGPTRAFAETKRLMSSAWNADLGQTLAAEGAAQARLGSTEDHRGAVEAFMAKQPARFVGR